MPLHRLATLVALSYLTISPHLQAADNSEILIRQGVELRKAGRDADAHTKFLRAYKVAHTPRAAAQLGLCERALKMWIEADLHLTEALAAQSDPWVLANKATIEESVGAVRSNLATVSVAGKPSDADVYINDNFVGQLPEVATLRVLPGKASVKVNASGFEPFEGTWNVTAGEHRQVDVDLKAIVSNATQPADPGQASTNLQVETATVPRESPGTWKRPVGISLGVGAALALGFGVLSHLNREGAASDFNDENGGCDRDNGAIIGGARCEQLASDYDKFSTRMLIGYGAAGGLAVAAAILLWPTAGESPSDQTSFNLRCAPQTLMSGVACAGTF
jgi:hypothetical protein